MKYYTVFDKSGRIIRSGTCPDGMLYMQGERVLEGQSNDLYQYVRFGEIINRPANPATVSGMIVRRIPMRSKVTIEGQTYPVDDGVLELSFEYPGTYRVTIESFPALPVEFEIENPS